MRNSTIYWYLINVFLVGVACLAFVGSAVLMSDIGTSCNYRTTPGERWQNAVHTTKSAS